MGLLSDVFGAVKDMVGDALEETPRDDIFTEFTNISEFQNKSNYSVYRSHISNEETIKKFLRKWYEIFSIDYEKSVKQKPDVHQVWRGFYSIYEELSGYESFENYFLEDCNLVRYAHSNCSKDVRLVYTGKNNKKIYFQFSKKIPMQLFKEDKLEYVSDLPTKVLLMSLDNPFVPDSILYTYYDLKDLLSKPQIMKTEFPDFEKKYEAFFEYFQKLRIEKQEQERKSAEEKRERERQKEIEKEREEKEKKQNELRNRQNQLIDSLNDL